MDDEDNIGDVSIEIPVDIDLTVSSSSDIILQDPVKNDRGYTPKRVKAIQLIGNRAGALVWMFNKSSKYYKNVNRVLTIIGAILSYLLGAGGIPTLAVVADYKNVNLGIQCGMIAVGVFMTIHAWLRLDDHSEKHKWASDKNTSLFLDCRREIDKPIEERTKADKFIHKKLKEEFEIFSDAPHVPNWVIKKYYKLRGANALPYEVIFHFDEDQLLIIDDDTQVPEARRWGEADQGTTSMLDVGGASEGKNGKNGSIINKLRQTIGNVKNTNTEPRESSAHRAGRMLDQNASTIRIREDVIDKMAEMEDQCNTGDYQPDLVDITRRHEELKPGVRRRRRQSTAPTAAQRFELEKYMT